MKQRSASLVVVTALSVAGIPLPAATARSLVFSAAQGGGSGVTSSRWIPRGLGETTSVLLSTPMLQGSGPAPAAQSYQSTCYHSIWGDGQRAIELDPGAYGAGYDCATNGWTFAVVTRDTWPDSELSSFNIALDADNNPATGCGGFEFAIAGTYTAGRLVAAVINTPTCDPTTWTTAGPAGISRTSQSNVALSISNTVLGSPNSIRWYGYIKGVAESSGAYMPDPSTVPSYHQEAGYANGVCNAPPFAIGGQSFFVTTAPGAAASALATAGLHPAWRGEGVLTLRGDPLAAEMVLNQAGIPALITADTTRRLEDVPNDPLYPQQWALAQVHAPVAWAATHGSASVVVADIDSGVDATHPDLAGKLVAGFDATTGTALGPGNSDSAGHGTATAGVIGAATDNGIGLASLGWNTMVMPIKAGDSSGIAASAAVAGIRFAADHGARVINMSFGGPCKNADEDAAVAYAQSKDVLLVAAAGNDLAQGDYMNYPAADPGVIAVGATGFDGTVAGYSNVNDYLSLVAPGGSGDGNPAHDVSVLVPGGGVTAESGTSFSSPMVAAAAALVRAVRPDLNAAQTAGLLTSTATDMGPPGRDPVSGFGLLNPGAALAAAMSSRPSPRGFWLLGRDGGVFTIGDVAFHGSTGNLRLNQPVVGLTAAPDRNGYWFVASDGGIFSFDVPFYGSTGNLHLAAPIVGMAATPDGKGYWFVAADGGVFGFGNAAFLGSGAGRFAAPVIGMAATPDGKGYWLVGADGSVRNYGDAPAVGSATGSFRALTVGILTGGAAGFWLAAADGEVGTFGQVPPHTGLAIALNAPIVGLG